MGPQLQGRKRFRVFQSTRGPGHQPWDRASQVGREARQVGRIPRSTEAKVRGSDSIPSGRRKPLGVFSRRHDTI